MSEVAQRAGAWPAIAHGSPELACTVVAIQRPQIGNVSRQGTDPEPFQHISADAATSLAGVLGCRTELTRVYRHEPPGPVSPQVVNGLLGRSVSLRCGRVQRLGQ